MSDCSNGCASDLCVYRGASFNQVYRYGAEPLVYKAVTGVPVLTPLTLTVVGHGVPNGWSQVAVTGLGGFDDGVNASDWPPSSSDFFQATVVDADTISFNEVDAARLGAYTTGGVLAYYTPVSLAGASVQFNVYPVDSDTPVLSIAAVLDDTGKTITVDISDTQTAALVSTDYAFSLVFTDAGGTVTVIGRGAIQMRPIGPV